MSLWLKIKILLGLKSTFCVECLYCHEGLCDWKERKQIDYVTGERGIIRPRCEDVNRRGRCLGFVNWKEGE